MLFRPEQYQYPFRYYLYLAKYQLFVDYQAVDTGDIPTHILVADCT